jgi:peptide/nickel transport system substrate-binding protein
LDKYDQDAELLKAKTLAGETDILFRVVRPSDFPVFKEKEEELGLQITFFDDVFNGRQTFMINQSYTGEAAIVELLETADFRRALSLALDRELMNESVHLGLGRPGHGFSPPGVFDEAIDGSYATRDPDAASALLDGIGLDQRDSDGMRTMADGSQLTIILMLRSGWGIGADETAEIATDNWRDIGLRVVAKPVERKLHSELINANDWQIRLNPSTGGWTGYWRYGMSLRQFAREAYDWIQSATEEERRGTEPQGKLKELADLQQLALQSQDKEESQMAFHQYREVLADQLFQIGTVANSPAILVHNGNLRNVPGQVMPAAISQGESEYLRFEQWYYQQ